VVQASLCSAHKRDERFVLPARHVGAPRLDASIDAADGEKVESLGWWRHRDDADSAAGLCVSYIRAAASLVARRGPA